MRDSYLSAQFVCTSIVFFTAIVHVIAAVRLRAQSAREFDLAAAFLFLGFQAVAFRRVEAGEASPFWLGLAGASHYLIFLALLRAMSSYRQRASRSAWMFHVAGLALAGANLFFDLPFTYRAAGDLDLWILGRLPDARMPLLTAATHIVFATLATGVGWDWIREARPDHPELRIIPPLIFVGFPLFCVGVLVWAGIVPAPPLTGFLAAVVAFFFAWHRLEQQVTLSRRQAPAAPPQASAPASSAPPEIAGYRLGKRLGAGGMAEVFLAERIGPANFAKRVALKRLLPHLVEDAQLSQMFLDEARLAARLDHPNIVHIFDLGHEDNAYFIVMEYVEGVSLQWLGQRRFSNRQNFPAPLVAQIGVQVLAGLAHAHGLKDEKGRPLGIVHRDVSPQNILITPGGVVKLLDFGIAHAAGRDQSTGTNILKGKVGYIAPEYVAGEGLDARADLFGLGVVLYQMVCGLRPFDAKDDVATIRNLLDGRKQPPSALVRDVPLPLEQVILRALERRPSDRFQTAGEMAAALRVYLNDAGSSGDGSALGRLVAAEMA